MAWKCEGCGKTINMGDPCHADDRGIMYCLACGSDAEVEPEEAS